MRAGIATNFAVLIKAGWYFLCQTAAGAAIVGSGVTGVGSGATGVGSGATAPTEAESGESPKEIGISETVSKGVGSG